MTIERPRKRRGHRYKTIVCLMPVFKPGDPEPKGYLEWHEWARVQAKAGLRQVRRRCGRWHFPQEVCEHD